MSPLEKLEYDYYRLSEKDKKAFLSVVIKNDNMTETSKIKAEVNEMRLKNVPIAQVGKS